MFCCCLPAIRQSISKALVAYYQKCEYYVFFVSQNVSKAFVKTLDVKV